MTFKDYLRIVVSKGATDLYLAANTQPMLKLSSGWEALDECTLSAPLLEKIARTLMDKQQLRQFTQKPDINVSIFVPDIGRFRANIFKQRNSLAIVIQAVQMQIPNVDHLMLPTTLKKQILESRGLVLFSGEAGSRTSDTVASLIEHRNKNKDGYIITIEEPIKYIHKNQQSLISQRDVGIDTLSYEDAIDSGIKQSPDVLMIDQLKTYHVIEQVFGFVESGRLGISTIQAAGIPSAMARMRSFFPKEKQKQFCAELSNHLTAFISQRLIKTASGKKITIIEILINTPQAAKIIREGNFDRLKEIMNKSQDVGMQTFDGHLYQLYKDGEIILKDAIKHADSPSGFKFRLAINKKLKPTAGIESAPPATEENDFVSEHRSRRKMEVIF